MYTYIYIESECKANQLPWMSDDVSFFLVEEGLRDQPVFALGGWACGSVLFNSED
jgi:hypothetical protein